MSAKPPNSTTSVAKTAEGRSEVATNERPPCENAWNRISSCLKVVGFTTMRTPLDNVHSVVPKVSLYVVFLIFPALGAFSTRFSRIASSTGASISSFFTAAKNSTVSASVGSTTVSSSGAWKEMIRFSSVTKFCAIWLSISTPNIGNSCCTISYSQAIPGIGSSLK